MKHNNLLYIHCGLILPEEELQAFLDLLDRSRIYLAGFQSATPTVEETEAYAEVYTPDAVDFLDVVAFDDDTTLDD